MLSLWKADILFGDTCTKGKICGSVGGRVANGDPPTITSCGWVSNDRLLCTLYGISDLRGVRLSNTRLVALDADGGNVVALGARERGQSFVQQSDGYVVDWLDGSTNKVLLARNYVPSSNQMTRSSGLYRGLGAA